MEQLDKMLKEQELQLWQEYKDGNLESRVKLIKSLEPLIQGQVNKFNGSGLPQTAVKLEGIKLTAQALETYDPSKSQLNTHVTNHLKKLSRFVTTYQNVGHIPEPRALMIGKYHTIYSNIESDKGREPSVSELADSMNVSQKEIERLQSELRGDLSIEYTDSDSDEAKGFYEYTQQTFDPKLKQSIDFVYFDADPTDKRILEWTLGLNGQIQKQHKDIAVALKLTDLELKKRRETLAKKIKELSF